MPRIQITRLRAAAATALLSLTLAAPAFAGHEDWKDDDHGGRRGYPVHRHEGHCDRDGWGHGDPRGHYGERGYEGGHGRRYDRGSYDGGGRHERDEYGCRPCGRRFGDRGGFHRHLARHHGIPFWAFPRVIVAVEWGWLFRG